MTHRAFAARLGYRLRRLRKRVAHVGLLRRIGAELLYCPFGAPTYAEPRVPVVCTIHDLQYRSYAQFFEPEDVARRDRVFADACRKATLVAAVSDYARDSAIRHGKLDASRITTIHHRLAGRLARAAVLDDAVLGQLGLQRGRYLVYPANFWCHKNHEMLLTAFGVAADAAILFDPRIVADAARARECLGWESRIGFDAMVHGMVDAQLARLRELGRAR